MIASGRIATSWSRNSALFLMAPGCSTAMPRRSAASFTGETATSIPRPRGRSGCVTTSGTECPAETSFSNVGTAKRGVPQKTRSISLRSQVSGLHKTKRATGSRATSKAHGTNVFPGTCHLPPVTCTSPLSRLHQFLDPALDKIPLQRADVRDVQFPVQVICLMQERPCQQLFSGVLEKLSAEVLRAHRHRFGPRDLLAKFGDAQAAFGAPLPAFFADDHRIDQDQLGRVLFLQDA